MYACAQSRPILCRPWTVAHQAPLSSEFPRQEYWSGISSFRESSQPRDPTHFFCVSYIGRWVLYHWRHPGCKRDLCYLSTDSPGHFNTVQFSSSAVSDSLRLHRLQHVRLPCPLSAPGACSNSCPSSQWCHPTISFSVISFSCLQYFPASGAFPMSQFFASGGQSIGASASASVLPMNIQDWFPLGLTGWISLQSKRLSRVFSNTTVQKHQFFGAQLSLWSNYHIHTWLLEKP